MPEHDEKPAAIDRAIKAIKDNPYGYGVLLIIILFVAHWAFTSYLGPKRPGAFLERTSYENTVYVQVYSDKTGTKNYYLPGDVSRGENGYTISEVSWPNGGDSTFDDCQITLGKRSECLITNSKEFENYDINSNDIDKLLAMPSYYIQLTNNVVTK